MRLENMAEQCNKILYAGANSDGCQVFTVVSVHFLMELYS